MRAINKKITAAFLTAALIVPLTAGVASAQSSFISGSSSSAEVDNPTQGSKSNQLKRVLEQALIDDGQIKSPSAETASKALLERALNYELPYMDGFYESVSYFPPTYSFVLRIPVEAIDAVIDEISAGGGFGEVSAPFGVAVGKDADYYYASLVMLAG